MVLLPRPRFPVPVPLGLLGAAPERAFGEHLGHTSPFPDRKTLWGSPREQNLKTNAPGQQSPLGLAAKAAFSGSHLLPRSQLRAYTPSFRADFTPATQPRWRCPSSLIGLGVLAPGLGTFADKLPPAIFGFRLHQCQDSFWPEPSELPARQRKQPGRPGAVQSTGEGALPPQPRAGEKPRANLCHTHTPSSPPHFCALGEELRESRPAFGNSPQPSPRNVEPYINIQASLAVSALVWREGKECTCGVQCSLSHFGRSGGLGAGNPLLFYHSFTLPKHIWDSPQGQVCASIHPLHPPPGHLFSWLCLENCIPVHQGTKHCFPANTST